MKAVAFTEFGGPEVLRVLDLPEPHAGPGEVRVRVKAAGVQPYDAAVRAGWEPPGLELGWPRVPGNEFAGVVDEGELEAGTEVLGFTAVRAAAEYIVVPASDVTPKPPEMPWEVAGGFTAGTQTASIALEALKLQAGETLLVHGAAGSVGTAAVQLAKLKGAAVIGTASASNQDYVRSLGATAVVYGEGLKARVAPLGVDVVLDGAGGAALDLSLELVKDRTRILTLVDHGRAAELGVLVSKSGRSAARLAELAALYAKGDLRFHVRRAYPYTEAAAAHREIETGHGRGKIVLTFP
ncbi:NADPH:quinone reductase-like Zn-dependent oxidoreductase [Amycolatopsis lexingtonensis]|uniref:NADPH:quinone reductase-like Zn-dependent oxidoreductase n=1 Tax=Amycolatopsis lexingtonensis TaxID=218822 RepID=A0ABR9IFT0_9PSEU|nr:NADP-dependent oxidoreductase [Amycolatopsis lexingtonensis]MBE1502035.1 NADPH:quinone reductase-like Zn-dependent oxidoreductase [Amycolatopsis lexingtonensis]